jgi:hypothetical protein
VFWKHEPEKIVERQSFRCTDWKKFRSMMRSFLSPLCTSDESRQV